MNFTVLTPSDSPLMYDKSDATHSNFSGNRAITSNINLQPEFDIHLSTSYITVSGGATVSGVNIPGTEIYKVFAYTEEELPHYAKDMFIEERYNLYNQLIASGVENTPDEYDFYKPGTGNYTHRYGNASVIKENPVDTSIKDIDEMSNLEERKNRFTQEEIKANCQEGNESVAIQSDPENRPRMDEGTDAIQVPSSTFRKQLKKANKWQFAKSEHYESEMS